MTSEANRSYKTMTKLADYEFQSEFFESDKKNKHVIGKWCNI